MDKFIQILLELPFFLLNQIDASSPLSLIILAFLLFAALLTGINKKELIYNHRRSLLFPLLLMLTTPIPLFFILIPGINIIAIYIPVFVFYTFAVYAVIQIKRLEGLRIFAIGAFGLYIVLYTVLLFLLTQLFLTLLWS